ncbi:heme ABC transporter permease [Saccharibacter sp. 17.LH.SD]|uniref:heme ABC transporter permease n=1 Tax=Saccharibacter sp. 17.LH.SD TaxID=2689393 RepID=UPI001370D2BB|nr:heme ABC transporter permease [Saccharibacter sp. 17.LH.SD]
MSPISSWFHHYANPGVFLRLVRPCLLPLGTISVILLMTGLIWGLCFSPADWQQGENVRIMYIHVPMAWLASACYVALALCGILSLVWRHPLADRAAIEIGPIGCAASALCLVTGSLWGKPSWGTWWVWDARLTSMLILFFLYLGHITVIRAFDDSFRGQKAAAILAIVGIVDLPIIKFSVQWWNTLHQPDSISLTATPTISLSLMWPLVLCTGGFTLGAITLVNTRLCASLMERQVQFFSRRGK